MEEFYKEYLDFFISKIENILPSNLIFDKKLFIFNIKKFLKREIEKIIAPSVCWLLWQKRDNLIAKNSKERFKLFVKKYKNSFKNQYPELDLILNKFLKREYFFINEIIKKISENFNYLNKIFSLKNKKLKRIIFINNADRHFKGFRTFFIDFEGKIIKVKPFDFSYNDFLINIFFSVEKEIFKNFPKYYSIDGWFFSKFISYKKEANLKSAKQFYFEIGKLMALSYCFNGVDFHLENIIVHKSRPIILDLESFATNFSLFKRNFKNNLYITGFLERNTKEPPTSAILGGNRKLISLIDPKIVARNTDRMYIIYKKYSEYKIQNRIFIKGKMVMPRMFKYEIIKGFEDFYLNVIRNRDKILNEIVNAKNIKSRVILRKTSFYGILIQHVIQPINFPLKNLKLKIKKALKKNSERFLNFRKENFKDVLGFELESIFNLEIPIFWQKIDEKNLYFPGKKVKDFFKKSAKEILIDKIESLSKKDLYQKLVIIKKVL